MPLTEQERLLLRLVHKDDPVELAMLDPRARALQDLEDKADFQRFFGQQTKRAVPEPSVTEPSLTQQQGVPPESTMEGAAPAQPGEGATPEQVAPEQPAQQPSTPEKFAPDESTTQQATPRTTRTTGENE
jgi:hypothetical protein